MPHKSFLHSRASKTLVGHFCETLQEDLCGTLAEHSLHLWDTLVGHSGHSNTLVRHSCRTFLGHSNTTLSWDTLWDTLMGTLLKFFCTEPPFMQEMHRRSACAALERVSCMKCQTTKTIPTQTNPKTTKQQPTREESRRL